MDRRGTLVLHEVKGHARCRLRAHARQNSERLYQRIKGMGIGFLHGI
jgi:hypothetical protein